MSIKIIDLRNTGLSEDDVVAVLKRALHGTAAATTPIPTTEPPESVKAAAPPTPKTSESAEDVNGLLAELNAIQKAAENLEALQALLYQFGVVVEGSDLEEEAAGCASNCQGCGENGLDDVLTDSFRNFVGNKLLEPFYEIRDRVMAGECTTISHAVDLFAYKLEDVVGHAFVSGKDIDVASYFEEVAVAGGVLGGQFNRFAFEESLADSFRMLIEDVFEECDDDGKEEHALLIEVYTLLTDLFDNKLEEDLS